MNNSTTHVYIREENQSGFPLGAHHGRYQTITDDYAIAHECDCGEADQSGQAAKILGELKESKSE